MGKKEKLFHSQNGLCWLCDKPMQLKTATWDHLLPVSQGGTWAPFNLKLAHESCNIIRSSHCVLTSREYVQESIQRYELRPGGSDRIRSMLVRDGVLAEPRSMYDRLYALLRSEGVIR